MKRKGAGEVVGWSLAFLLRGIFLLLAVWSTAPRADTEYAVVTPGHALKFPEDEGSHPEFRTEWWYLTGWLQRAGGKPLGFQITFFRTRPKLEGDNPSAFAPRQILMAHVALSDPEVGRLLHDQHIARAGFNLAEARQGKTHVWIDDWSLEQSGTNYLARIPAREFELELKFGATLAPLLEGENGFSRKGPAKFSASYYYSLPQLKVSGHITRQGKPEAVTGSAWLDHEWSSSYLDHGAVGWDWIGINLDNGGALMVFRIRDKQGGTYWAGGAYLQPDGKRTELNAGDIDFLPLRQWRSARTGANYPVAWRVRAGDLTITLEPLMDDQENDARASTGTIYWEGAVRVLQNGQPIGHGYLELTGYWRPLKM